MQVISIFNNKGGVGKSTLAFHTAHALALLNHKTLLLDLDPQCNLTLYGMSVEDLHAIWETEEPFIDSFEITSKSKSNIELKEINSKPRTIHYLLKPTEEGTGEIDSLPPPVTLASNLDLIPGRLSLHMFEEAISARWSEAFLGKPLAIRTITRIRSILQDYCKFHKYEIVVIDTSPSLGVLNKVVLSISDGFIIPCMPDMFSLYGIRNIGKALSGWKHQFELIYSLLSDEKRKLFPSSYVKFLGYTLYNARKVSRTPPVNEYNIAQSHYNYARQIPSTIESYISADIRDNLSRHLMESAIASNAVMYSHNTLPGMAQKYKRPMWDLPSLTTIESEDMTIIGNRSSYEATKDMYMAFAKDLLLRVSTIPKLTNQG
ncbi:MAG: ParA family protein [Elusimicrobia bacterium]|nr:ParA family protein [Elusimicrobiota bacterium]